MQHKTIAAQGGIVHYWIDIKENTANCIVFTHGVTADHTMFEKRVSCFSGKYTMLLWDVPMHGLSRPYQGFSYHDTAEILLKIRPMVAQAGCSNGKMFSSKYSKEEYGLVGVEA